MMFKISRDLPGEAREYGGVIIQIWILRIITQIITVGDQMEEAVNLLKITMTRHVKVSEF